MFRGERFGREDFWDLIMVWRCCGVEDEDEDEDERGVMTDEPRITKSLILCEPFVYLG